MAGHNSTTNSKVLVKASFGHPVWPARVPADHRHAPAQRLGVEQQMGGADLAAGGAEGTGQATQERAVVAERQVMCEAAASGQNDMWAYDFVQVRTRDGRAVRLLTVIDEYTRECLAIQAGRSIRSTDVIDTLANLMTSRGVPAHIRSDNGPEFTARVVREWLVGVGARTLYIEPESP